MKLITFFSAAKCNHFSRQSKYFLIYLISEKEELTLVEAKEVMKFDRMTKEEQDTYIRHLDAVANEKEAILTAEIRGKIDGRAEGRAEGAQSEKLETARRMKSKGFDNQTIADLTQLPLDEIEGL